MSPDLSIVIVSFNTKSMLRDCLAALRGAAGDLSAETFLVDNNSPDGSADMVRLEFPDVWLIANTENVGFARANNQAIRQALGRYVVLLNPDTEAERGSLAVLASHLDAHPDVGAAGPMLLNSDGSLQRNGRLFPTPWSELLSLLGLSRLCRRWFERRFIFGREDFSYDACVDGVSGACLMVRRDVIDKVGPLDERFFMFYEEVEWCWRIKKAGWRIAYVADARVVHHWMGSVRQRGRAMAARLRESRQSYYQATGTGSAAVVAAVNALAAAQTEALYLGSRLKQAARRLLGRRGAAPRDGA